jgi:Protein of unknown function (DUF1156)
VTSNKKLIEVALAREAIGKASAREGSIRHDHPSTLHRWWARWFPAWPMGKGADSVKSLREP